nr:MAG TPA: hypothetical protein [Caudoviricetes sp.]
MFNRRISQCARRSAQFCAFSVTVSDVRNIPRTLSGLFIDHHLAIVQILGLRRLHDDFTGGQHRLCLHQLHQRPCLHRHILCHPPHNVSGMIALRRTAGAQELITADLVIRIDRHLDFHPPTSTCTA